MNQGTEAQGRKPENSIVITILLRHMNKVSLHCQASIGKFRGFEASKGSKILKSGNKCMTKWNS